MIQETRNRTRHTPGVEALFIGAATAALEGPLFYPNGHLILGLGLEAGFKLAGGRFSG